MLKMELEMLIRSFCAANFDKIVIKWTHFLSLTEYWDEV